MKKQVHPLILAGGCGSRLWPLSRQLNPKQFLPLIGCDFTMFQQAVSRLSGEGLAEPLVICKEEHRFLAAEQLRVAGCNDAHIILEPFGRNTAPAITLATLRLLDKCEDGYLLVLPADHFIHEEQVLWGFIRKALPVAEEGKLVTFGVVPAFAETGYGYIRKGAALDTGGFIVERFVEKPDYGAAQSYLESGDYLWNSGMFLFKASRYLEELERFRPDILEACPLCQPSCPVGDLA